MFSENRAGGETRMTPNAFIPWLQREIDERADGRPAVFAQLIRMSPTAVASWVEGRATPSLQACIKMARVVELSWREIATLAGSRHIGGPLWHSIEIEDEEAPEAEPQDNLLDRVLWEGKYKGCTGCGQHVQNGHADRRIICDALRDHELPMPCEPIDGGTIVRLIYILEGGDAR